MKDVSPLKLTSFEEYMFFDDSSDYPMTGFFRLRFSTKLIFEAMDAAIQATVARHPLVRSRVCHSAKHGHYWVEDESSSVVLERWSADSQNEYPVAAFMDLTQSVGTRIWLVDRMGAQDLVVQMHHACTDALGMCQFIDDLLILYARNVGSPGSDVELRPLDNQRLPLRNRFGLSWKKVLQLIPRQVFGLHVIGKFLIRRAVPLGISTLSPTTAQHAVFPSPLTVDFDLDHTSRILAHAKKRNVTVNELLTRDLFLAIKVWRTQNGADSGKEWLRFFVPINHRTAEDETLSAANIMGAVFLERQTGTLKDTELLLRSIQAQMGKIKRNQLGFLFVAAHALMSRVPRMRNLVIRQDRCVSSCVFSNLGVILNRTALPRRDAKLAFGDTVLNGVDFIAPLRPLTSAAFCVWTYAGRLCINLNFDPRSISTSQTRQLLQIFVDQIHESANGSDEFPMAAVT